MTGPLNPSLQDSPKLPFEPLIRRNAVITEQPWVRWLLTGGEMADHIIVDRP